MFDNKNFVLYILAINASVVSSAILLQLIVLKSVFQSYQKFVNNLRNKAIMGWNTKLERYGYAKLS